MNLIKNKDENNYIEIIEKVLENGNKKYKVFKHYTLDYQYKSTLALTKDNPQTVVKCKIKIKIPKNITTIEEVKEYLEGKEVKEINKYRL